MPGVAQPTTAPVVTKAELWKKCRLSMKLSPVILKLEHKFVCMPTKDYTNSQIFPITYVSFRWFFYKGFKFV
jgi:hypothetical protein